MRTKEKFCVCSKCFTRLAVTVKAGNRTAGKIAHQTLQRELKAKGWQCVNLKTNTWFCNKCVRFPLRIFDSANGQSIVCEKLVVLGDLELQYGRATRGPLVQLAHMFSKRHYFYLENIGRLYITQDELEYGIENLLDIIDEHAP